MTRDKDITKRKLTKIDFLVEFFIKPGETFSWSDKDWGRERFACKRLTNDFPDFDFFYTLTDMQGKFNSLLGLLGKFNKTKLQERYKTFVLEKDKNKQYKMEDLPVIEIKLENKPARNILDFVRN